MLALAAELTEALRLPALAVATAFFRVTGLMLFLPGLGERAVPARVRLAAAAALAAVLGPLMPPAAVPAQIGPGLIAAEIATGAAFGAVLRMLAAALLVAGTIAAQATSLSQLFGVPGAEPSSALGTTLHLAGLALILASGLPLYVVEMLLRSWEVVPPGLVPAAADATEWGVARMGEAFALALALATPFVVVSMIYNLTLGVLNKAMPQLMVALVGAPAITGLALIVLAACAPLILDTWRLRMEGALIDPLAPLP